ncbi:hypothetical protein CC86DRAFT_118556 [Ophiobolus disseminans]|uniref:DUF7580 domain-containing protein n=1 Tax=Ophiobolus disseminans TaxID=1469910 RepID=A0A6A6ZGJ3_9PLEO|nr:hypothetical protein CC86DRAFT_118556 [Ophiobolus disseminans]
MLMNLLSTVAKHLERCRCVKPHKPHKALLLLCTHKILSEKDWGSFRILFSQAAGVCRWKETIIEVKEELVSGQVQIVLPDSNKQFSSAASRRIPILSLCTSIQNVTLSPLHLCVERGALYQQSRSSKATTKILSQGVSTSLSYGLLENETELDMKGRICLGTVLPYSLLDFCGEPWFPDGWTRDGIYLLRHGQLLSLRPALVTRASNEGNSISSVTVTNDLRLLYHGILLMEIFRQEALPINLSLNKAADVDDLGDFARKEFAAIEPSWDVCERYKQSVEVCIEGLVLGEECDDAEAFARTSC